MQPNFKTLGSKLGSRLNKLIAALGVQNPSELKVQMDSSKNVRVVVDGETIVLEADDLVFTILPLASYSIAADAKAIVAVNTQIDEKLAREGLMRELLRKLQELRKEVGLDISDRITLQYSTDSDKLAEVFKEWSAYIMDELLCEHFSSVVSAEKTLDVLGSKISVTIQKV